MCRIRSDAIAQRLDEILGVYRHDDVKARQLEADGSYHRVATVNGVRAQDWLIQRALATAGATLVQARPDRE